jgi:hypothetical protein
VNKGNLEEEPGPLHPRPVSLTLGASLLTARFLTLPLTLLSLLLVPLQILLYILRLPFFCSFSKADPRFGLFGPRPTLSSFWSGLRGRTVIVPSGGGGVTLIPPVRPPRSRRTVQHVRWIV